MKTMSTLETTTHGSLQKIPNIAKEKLRSPGREPSNQCSSLLIVLHAETREAKQPETNSEAQANHVEASAIL